MAGKTVREVTHQRRKQLLVLLCAISNVYVHGQGCVYQECSCVDTSIICEAKELSKMPTLSSSQNHYSSLNLDMNAITVIPAGSFPPGLTSISMEDNPILIIDDAAFNDCASTLESLAFSSVRFTRIPDALCQLKALTSLDITDASIQEWNEGAMENIGQTLQTLDLDDVGMTSWPNWLKYFTCLTELTITGESISSIPDGALDNLTDTLISLSLNNNDLIEVPKAISKLTSLQQLYLQQNNIVDITWLPQASQLSALSLSNNLISNSTLLSEAIRPFASSLDRFLIHSNRLTSIPNITFLIRIGSLDFSNNKLSDIYSGVIASSVDVIDFSNNFLPAVPHVLATLNSMPKLSMSSNSIREIDQSNFLPSTTTVELGLNLITELADNSFPENSKIKSLYLNNNPISLISNGAFINLAQLKELHLQGTRLLRLPLALGSLDSLSSLDMTGNANLVCTCHEKNLEAWVLSSSRISVLGNCGLVDIYEFFSTLSQACPTPREMKYIDKIFPKRARQQTHRESTPWRDLMSLFIDASEFPF